MNVKAFMMFWSFVKTFSEETTRSVYTVKKAFTMVLEIAGASVLVAFGLLVMYWSAEEGFDDKRIIMIFLIGLIAIIAGGWIIFSRITLATLLTKIAGIILALVGFFLVTGFPDVEDYQPMGMSKVGVLIGLVMLIFGLYLIFFA